jgi:hypothetical protein
MTSDDTPGDGDGFTRRTMLSGMAIGTAATVLPGSAEALIVVPGKGGGAPNPALAAATGLIAPRLELAVGLATYPPSFDLVDIADSLRPGDRLVLIIGQDARFEQADRLHYDLSGDEGSQGAEAVFRDDAGRSLADYTAGTHWTYAYVERGGKASAPSNTVLHGAAEKRRPEWSFTDAIDVAPKGMTATGPVKPTGFNLGLPVAVSNGEYRIGTAKGFGPWTAKPGTIYPGDLIDHRHADAPVPLAEVRSSVTIGETTRTFMTRTVADQSAAVWNALDKSSAVSLSNANLTATATYPPGIGSVRATFGRGGSESSRFAGKVTYGGNNVYLGLSYIDAPLDRVPGRHNDKGIALHAAVGGWEVYSGGKLIAFDYGGGGKDGDVLALERAGMMLTFKRNGTVLWRGPMPPGAGKIYAYFAADGSTTVCTADFTGY